MTDGKLSTIKLRPVRTTDAAMFHRWWHDPRLIRPTSGDYRSLTETQFKKYFTQLRTSARAKHWVIEQHEKPIGHVSLRGHGPSLEIQIVIGEPKLWGQGIGTAVGLWLTTHAGHYKLYAVRMHVWQQNKRSIALGKKFGFRMTGKIKRRIGRRTRTYLTMTAVLTKSKHTAE